MIDLHLHTTASDGLLAPDALVAAAAGAGITVLAVTDHDTVAGIPEAAAAAAPLGVRLVTGIEITAVEQGRDVHVLGYFLDPESGSLAALLEAQRFDRIRRVREVGELLRELGSPVDVDGLIAGAGESHRTIGRPAIADALIAAGFAADRTDAFARLLGRGRPAFVPRSGVGVRQIVEVIHAADGVASLAHPGVLDIDALIPGMVDAGLDAIEVWHTDHTPEHVARYGEMAARFDLARSGGSDYHGDGAHRAGGLGSVALPKEEFAVLERRAGGQ